MHGTEVREEDGYEKFVAIGQIETGELRPNMLVALEGNVTAQVGMLIKNVGFELEDPKDRAEPGDLVEMYFDTHQNVSAGDIIGNVNDPPLPATEIEGTLAFVDRNTLISAGDTLLLGFPTGLVPCRVEEISRGRRTGINEATFALLEPTTVESCSDGHSCGQLGRFVAFDKNNTRHIGQSHAFFSLPPLFVCGA